MDLSHIALLQESLLTMWSRGCSGKGTKLPCALHLQNFTDGREQSDSALAPLQSLDLFITAPLETGVPGVRKVYCREQYIVIGNLCTHVHLTQCWWKVLHCLHKIFLITETSSSCDITKCLMYMQHIDT